MRSYRRFSCTSIWCQAFRNWLRSRTRELYDRTNQPTSTTARIPGIQLMSFLRPGKIPVFPRMLFPGKSIGCKMNVKRKGADFVDRQGFAGGRGMRRGERLPQGVGAPARTTFPELLAPAGSVEASFAAGPAGGGG